MTQQLPRHGHQATEEREEASEVSALFAAADSLDCPGHWAGRGGSSGVQWFP